ALLVAFGIHFVWQREREGRPRAEPTLHPDPAAVELHEPPAERQPEAGPLRLLVRSPDLTELFEYRVVIFRSDADAGVRDRNLDPPVRERSAHIDPPTFRRELHGVREQVQQDLLYLPLVCAELAEARVDTALDGDAATSCPLAHEQQRIVDRRWQIERGDVE